MPTSPSNCSPATPLGPDEPTAKVSESPTSEVGTDLDAELAKIKVLLDKAALIYNASEHGGLEQIARYYGSGGEPHRVCINRHPDVDWRVIDVSPDGSATLVGRLDGADDLRSQATACAEDYATQCRLFHAGQRDDPPVLRPKPMQMTYIHQPRRDLRRRSRSSRDSRHPAVAHEPGQHQTPERRCT
jgi:hypothetical protein